MATDDERRRAAASLRECIIDTPCGDDWRYTLLCSVAEAVGLTPDHDPTVQDLCDRLADLIDPPTRLYDSPDSSNSGADEGLELAIDREALLALEREMRFKAKESEAYFAGIHPGEVVEYADRIRGACGEVA